LLKSNVAAKDAEGPPTYLRERVVDGCADEESPSLSGL